MYLSCTNEGFTHTKSKATVANCNGKKLRHAEIPAERPNEKGPPEGEPFLSTVSPGGGNEIPDKSRSAFVNISLLKTSKSRTTNADQGTNTPYKNGTIPRKDVHLRESCSWQIGTGCRTGIVRLEFAHLCRLPFPATGMRNNDAQCGCECPGASIRRILAMVRRFRKKPA